MERELLQRLMNQAFLYDDPNAYRAGVQAAWGALALLQESATPMVEAERPGAPATQQPARAFG